MRGQPNGNNQSRILQQIGPAGVTWRLSPTTFVSHWCPAFWHVDTAKWRPWISGIGILTANLIHVENRREERSAGRGSASDVERGKAPDNGTGRKISRGSPAQARTTHLYIPTPASYSLRSQHTDAQLGRVQEATARSMKYSFPGVTFFILTPQQGFYRAGLLVDSNDWPGMGRSTGESGNAMLLKPNQTIQ
jgi:hypothetical protein